MFFPLCRMKRASSAADLANASVMSRSDAAIRAVADHGYATPPPKAMRGRHASLPIGATASTWVPPVVAWRAGPPATRRRRDTMTSQFAESDVASGDSYHTPKSAVICTPPNARSLTSTDVRLDQLQSQLTAATPSQMGGGICHVAFSRGHAQRAFGHALIIERYTPNMDVASFAEILVGLRDSLGACLRDLIAEYHGLKLWMGLDVLYRHMSRSRVPWGTSRHTHCRHAQRLTNRAGARPTRRRGAVPRCERPAERQPICAGQHRVARPAGRSICANTKRHLL